MSAPPAAPESREPLNVALSGYEHEWPSDFEAFVARELVARDGAFVARIGDIAEAPAFLAAGDVHALIVNADRLGVKGMLVLRECRRVSPATAVVAVATTAARGLKDALEGGATAFVSWPAAPDVVRRALRSGRAPAVPIALTHAWRRRGPMSTHTRATTVARRRTATPPPPAAPAPVVPTLSREAAALRHKAGGEIAALLRLAELDAALLRRPEEQREAALRDAAAERKTLGARISRDVLDAYSKALRGGRQPAVARVVAGVCYGCFVRLHAKLEHHLRQQRGVGSCPHCLRVVYDPAWLSEPAREEIGRR